MTTKSGSIRCAKRTISSLGSRRVADRNFYLDTLLAKPLDDFPEVLAVRLDLGS